MILIGEVGVGKASRILAASLIHSSLASGMSALPGAGFDPQDHKDPIMSMTRSANVKIHSGHSSHSVFLHLHLALAMGSLFSPRRHGGRGGCAYSFKPITRRRMPSTKTVALKLISNPTCEPPSRRWVINWAS